MTTYYIVNVYKNKKTGVVYGELRDNDDVITISAELDYIFNRIEILGLKMERRSFFLMERTTQ